jgi:hypothetical protein
MQRYNPMFRVSENDNLIRKSDEGKYIKVRQKNLKAYKKKVVYFNFSYKFILQI